MLCDLSDKKKDFVPKYLERDSLNTQKINRNLTNFTSKNDIRKTLSSNPEKVRLEF